MSDWKGFAIFSAIYVPSYVLIHALVTWLAPNLEFFFGNLTGLFGAVVCAMVYGREKA